PLSLAGISVEIRPGEQPARKLPLIFASPSQINAVLPQDATPGLQTVSVVRADSTRMETQAYLASAAPALFFISRNGQNYAAATLLRVSPDGTRTTQSLVSVDPATGAALPVPIDTNTPGDLYLSLYGTGFHQVGSDAVSVSVGSEEATVLYVGPQGGTMGLDQINIPLPRLVASTTSAAIEVSVATATGASMRANPVEVVFGGLQITAAR
ncbi:MAG TPA: hypothetical protein VG672_23350, partial [Bryobacteraceae bacterium]|nr:hypothetical protein [Bryobacteraceae bacterium]